MDLPGTCPLPLSLEKRLGFASSGRGQAPPLHPEVCGRSPLSSASFAQNRQGEGRHLQHSHTVLPIDRQDEVLGILRSGMLQTVADQHQETPVFDRLGVPFPASGIGADADLSGPTDVDIHRRECISSFRRTARFATRHLKIVSTSPILAVRRPLGSGSRV